MYFLYIDDMFYGIEDRKFFWIDEVNNGGNFLLMVGLPTQYRSLERYFPFTSYRNIRYTRDQGVVYDAVKENNLRTYTLTVKRGLSEKDVVPYVEFYNCYLDVTSHYWQVYNEPQTMFSNTPYYLSFNFSEYKLYREEENLCF